MWNIIATILVLAVIAIGLVEVYQQYGSASNQQSAQNLTQEVAEAIGNVNNAYAANPDFTNFTDATVGTISAQPSDWQGSGPYQLPEGGTATFSKASVNGGSDNGFSLALSNLSQQECGALAGFYTQQMAGVRVNGGGSASLNPAFGGAGPWPQNLVGSCTTGSSNTVTYTVVGQ